MGRVRDGDGQGALLPLADGRDAQILADLSGEEVNDLAVAGDGG